ncbi:MAG: Auxin Efflux Carrier [Chlorobi bacterium]|nr:Auxin Efflux Carrier [Chlorobiota bacterium]
MDSLLLLCVCFFLGIILGRTGRFPAEAPATLNAFIINISLPALALVHIHELRLNTGLILPAIAPWILFLGGALIIPPIGRRMRLPERTIGCLVLMAGLGNTSFVGIPMIQAFYGRDAIGTGMLVDQLGSFLALATVGLITAARYSGGTGGRRATMARVFRFVPFWGMVAGFMLMPVTFPEPLVLFLQKLGDTLTPLALVSVGLQLRPGGISGRGRPLAMGLLWKMLVGPLLILLIVALMPGAWEITRSVSVFEIAMPPMITAGIIAIEHDLDPQLAMLMLGVGIPLSFITLPLWWYLMR